MEEVVYIFNKKILVINDEPMFTDLLKSYLENIIIL